MLPHLSIVIDELNTTNSILEKKKILKKYPDVKDIFKYIYEPQYIFHVTSKSILKYDKNDIVKIEDSIFDLLDNLRNGVWTGHNAIRKVLGYIKKNGHKALVLKIIDKDLKIRMGTKQINAVFPNLISEFSVALAETIEKQMNYLTQGGKWWIMRKLDGVRCICIIGKQVRFFSREGKPILTLGKIEEILQTHVVPKLKKPMVLDGEICIMNNGLESFSGIMKEIKKKDHTIAYPIFKVFDCFTKEDFDNGENCIEYDKRCDLASKLINKCKNTNMIQCLEKYEYTDEKFSEMQGLVLDQKWEGLILRKNTGYEGKRTKNLLKVKTFHREEYKVVRMESAPISNNGSEYANQMGLKHVIIMHKGCEVDVGSGFTCDERKYYHDNENEIVGKIISVQYFEEIERSLKSSTNYSLRFPTFKGIYGEKREH